MAKSLILTICLLLAGVSGWAQSPATETPAGNPPTTAPARGDAAAVRQEIEQLKKTLAELEKRLKTTAGRATSAAASAKAGELVVKGTRSEGRRIGHSRFEDRSEGCA